ncbi:hypothetical protein pb186bvf_012711 [Paramecium bursaria]
MNKNCNYFKTLNLPFFFFQFPKISYINRGQSRQLNESMSQILILKKQDGKQKSQINVLNEIWNTLIMSMRVMHQELEDQFQRQIEY